ncbi:DUF2384 domain-containing protein [bacterium]|nr:DUF2384 domain-containing protein [bacterium]
MSLSKAKLTRVDSRDKVQRGEAFVAAEPAAAYATVGAGRAKAKVARATKSVPARPAYLGRAMPVATALAPLAAHDLVTKGLPIAAAQSLIQNFSHIDRPTILATLGISERTLQRAAAADKVLDSFVSDRALRMSNIAQRAAEVLGSQESAERWLITPALGLDKRRPIDLLQSTDGTELVKTLLVRMDYGVYA